MSHTIVTIENGNVKHDVIGETGQTCRQLTDPYMQALLDKFGLPQSALKESCKPEMQQPAQRETETEGDKLV